MKPLQTLLPASWQHQLQDEFTQEYFKKLELFLKQEMKSKKIFPNYNNLFNAYNLTPFENVKVVILGQDPYHDDNQAHGLAFSVLQTKKFPPSLNNIFKELCEDEGCSFPTTSDLSSWAKQGVFLINAVLSVEAHKANSHKAKGWENFTNATIKKLNQEHHNLVFILWGKPAQEKIKLIDETKHLILKAPHPSPLSSYRGFFGSKPFSQTNEYLKVHQKEQIKWCL